MRKQLRTRTLKRALACCAAALLLIVGGVGFVENSSEAEVTAANCPLGEAQLNSDGQLKLALIVGIDDYSGVSKLSGAVNDAKRMARQVVGKGAGQFPKSNVCVLLNKEATYSNFIDKFDKALVDRAIGNDGRAADDVLIFFAGHGSYARDKNGDEPDGRDETLVLQDSRIDLPAPLKMRVPDLRDDDFNQLISKLYEKTENIAVILDSCHSGTATRGLNGAMRNRFVDADVDAGDVGTRDIPGSAGDGGFGFAQFAPEDFPNAVILAAAADSQAAVELNGAGVFTTALIDTLAERAGTKTTYDQLFAQVQAKLGLSYSQKPTISGAGARYVFADGIAYRPNLDWSVVDTKPDSLEISGVPTPGMGEGAEFVIVPGSASAEEAEQAALRSAQFRAISALSGNVWVLEPIGPKSLEGIQRGDYALMVKPSSRARVLRVGAARNIKIEGIENHTQLLALLNSGLDSALRPVERELIQTSSDEFDFLIASKGSTRIELRDAGGVVRNIYSSKNRSVADLTENIAFDLADHLKQKSLLDGWSSVGGDFVPNQTLAVWLKPIQLKPGQGFCRADYKLGSWVQAEPNRTQEVPLCQAYEIWVKLADDAVTPVNVAASVLSANGRMDPLPAGEQRAIRLWKSAKGVGDSVSLGRFQATPDSLKATEYVYVLGLPEDMPVPWHLLSTHKRQAPLEFGIGARAFGTYSIVPIRTVANSGFSDRSKVQDAAVTREYTISNFDIAPYLPDAGEESSLYRVLKAADGLANPVVDGVSLGDGVSYKQHAWCKGSTEANLAEGIDCSRAIWFAFTRAGVPYNRFAASLPDEAVCVAPYDPEQDGYLYTGDMARTDFLMSDQFEDCLSASDSSPELKTGDILVYRDAVRGDGHTVMVIDPDKRIAWGSHGWDGNPKFIDPDTNKSPDPDLGVEYQKIKIKQDWARWDRSTMELKACWRHKSFISEAKDASFVPGLAAICDKALEPGTAYAKSSICTKLVDEEVLE